MTVKARVSGVSFRGSGGGQEGVRRGSGGSLVSTRANDGGRVHVKSKRRKRLLFSLSPPGPGLDTDTAELTVKALSNHL
eukprot:971373-Pyramimonas_sp.AAC.1